MRLCRHQHHIGIRGEGEGDSRISDDPDTKLQQMVACCHSAELTHCLGNIVGEVFADKAYGAH